MPRTASEIADVSEVSTAVVLSSVRSEPVVRDLKTQRLLGFPLKVESVLAGSLASTNPRAVFNVAPESRPLDPGRYVLFLTPYPGGDADDYVVAYGLRGSYQVDGEDVVHPRCSDVERPGVAMVGASSESLADFKKMLSTLNLGSAVH